MVSPVSTDPRYGTAKDPFNIAGNVMVTHPSMDFGRYKVNVPGTVERIAQPLYSYQLYPASGSTVLNFFQAQVGGALVTAQDTNMVAQGQLPSPQRFLIQGIGIDYLPGMTAAPPMTAPRADAATGALNDMYTIFRQGVFTLSIGSKQYFQMAPLLSLPPRSHYNAATALSSQTTPAAALQTTVQIPFADGEVYRPIPILLESNQNFNVNIQWPNGAVPTPSTDALARIGVVLYGTLERPAQ